MSCCLCDLVLDSASFKRAQQQESDADLQLQKIQMKKLATADVRILGNALLRAEVQRYESHYPEDYRSVCHKDRAGALCATVRLGIL